MEEEMRQGMMGADVQTTPEPAPAPQSRFVEVVGDRVENNLQNLSEQEMQLITTDLLVMMLQLKRLKQY